MSHIDTLKTYEAYRASGMDEALAKELTNSLERSFSEIHKSLFDEVKEWFKEAKADFASQKLIAILGGLILLAMTTGIGLMWHISLELGVLKTCGIERK